MTPKRTPKVTISSTNEYSVKEGGKKKGAGREGRKARIGGLIRKKSQRTVDGSGRMGSAGGNRKLLTCKKKPVIWRGLGKRLGKRREVNLRWGSGGA